MKAPIDLENGLAPTTCTDIVTEMGKEERPVKGKSATERVGGTDGGGQ